MQKKNIAVVGLGFGESFVPIYRDHPDVGEVGIFDSSREVCRRTAEKYGISRVYGSFEEILADSSLDAVHLITPIPLHADQTVAVLESGKHCACTVPMATTLEDIRRITETVRRTGLHYMMMETTLYTYHFLHVRKMYENGELGRIQFLRGSHYQDMANWPEYWNGLPPMWYGTHAIAPMVSLSGSRICRVHCVGSGVMEEALTKQYENPFPIESALFEFENGLKGEATRSLFATARAYQEGMFVYGSRASFEWGFEDGDDPYITCAQPPREGERGGRTQVSRISVPNDYHTLPESIRKYTIRESDFDPLNPQKSLETGGGSGHHGSHPHLVHEFIRSLVEDRRPAIDETLGGNITAAGICAHESAMQNGAAVDVPIF